MARKGRPQAPKIGRASSGTSSFSEWRGRLGLTQLDAAELLGVGATTTQRWDAHPRAAPPLLTPAMAYHETMRAESAWIKNAWLPEEAAAALIDGRTMPATRENINLLSPAGKLALEYGLAHALF